MVVSLIAFVGVSLVAFLMALLVFEGVVLPTAIGVFCGFAASVLNATDVMARWTRRNHRGR